MQECSVDEASAVSFKDKKNFKKNEKKLKRIMKNIE